MRGVLFGGYAAWENFFRIPQIIPVMKFLACCILFLISPCFAIDENEDGMSDVWQEKHGISSAEKDLDSDGDGFLNWEEERWGTDPRDAKDKPLVSFVTATGSTVVISTIKGKRVQLQRSSDLQSWDNVGPEITGTGESVSLEIGELQNASFFRLVSLPDPDFDEDGLTNFEEILLGSNEFLDDSDQDGLSDGYEYARFFKLPSNNGNPSDVRLPKEPTAINNPDNDGDGQIDAVESILFLSKAEEASGSKVGFYDYQTQANNNSPPPGRQIIEVYKKETRWWTDINEWVDPELPIPCPIPSGIEPGWGPGQTIFQIADDPTDINKGILTENYGDGPIEIVGERSGLRIALPKKLSEGIDARNLSLENVLISNELSYSQQYNEGYEVDGGPNTCEREVGGDVVITVTVEGPTFGIAEYGAVLSELYENEENIEKTWNSISSPVLENKNEGVSASVSVSENEIQANVKKLKYAFIDSGSGSANNFQFAEVFVPENGSALQVRAKSGPQVGELPSSMDKGESSLFWLDFQMSQDCVSVDEKENIIYVGSQPEIELIATGICGEKVSPELVGEFTVSINGMTASDVTWNTAVNQLRIKSVIESNAEAELPLSISLGGSKIWEGFIKRFATGNNIVFITPSGDPTTCPINTGRGKNQFSYDNSFPQGNLNVTFSALFPCAHDLPDSEKDKYRFIVEPIRGSVLTWPLKEDGKAVFVGDKMFAHAHFAGLPKNNEEFGIKNVMITYDGQVIETEDFEVFFEKDANNHPGDSKGKTPNWFHYWKQFIPLGRIETLEYSTGIGYGETNPVSRTTEIRQLASEENDETGHVGIHTFYETIAHEEHHIVLWEGWWGVGGLPNSIDDSDNDTYPDSFENGILAQSFGFLVGKNDHYGNGVATPIAGARWPSESAGYNYEEEECRDVERALDEKKFDKMDWSYDPKNKFQGKNYIK